MKMRRLLFILLLVWFQIPFLAQTKSKYKVVHYDEYNGLSQRYISQIVQGDDGFIWVGTWNGLNRYDGYEFINFKSCNTDVNHMPSDRIVNLLKSTTGNLWCQLDKRVYLFDTHTYQYIDVLTPLEKKINKELDALIMLPTSDGKVYLKCNDQTLVELTDSNRIVNARICKLNTSQLPKYPSNARIYNEPELSGMDYVYSITDDGGNDWVRSNYGIYKMIPRRNDYNVFPMENPVQIRCLYRDHSGCYWMTGKEDKTVRLYDKDNHLLGFLCPNGSLSKQYISFGSAVYCIYQDSRERIWLGCKPDGLFCLNKVKDSFQVTQMIKEKKSSLFGVYDIKEDAKGRLWIASFDKGLLCFSSDGKELSNQLTYPHNVGRKVRHLLITPKQELLIATTEGLFVADIRPEEVNRIHFYRHICDLKRPNSLSNNATMFLFQDRKGILYVCTESGGLNRIDSKNLLDEKLNFTHYDTTTGLSSDIALSMIEYDNYLWIISNSQLIRLTPHNNESTSFDNYFFKYNFRFSDAAPLQLNNEGRWIFGLQQGAIILNLASLKKSSFKPKIAITGLSIQNGKKQLAVNGLDTITLNANERSLTIYFSALDYAANNNLKYSFNLNNGKWNYLGENHSATFLDLSPGIYMLKLRSTNHDGLWMDNIRTITIVVKPAWWETIYAKIMYLFLIIGFFYSVYRVIRYIREVNIRAKNLEAYLSLMKINDEANSETTQSEELLILEKAQIKAVDDAFMKRVLAFVEQHISDSNINIGDMAEAAATSKAGLNRKLKTLLGITPNEFLREARIQKACTLLKTPSTSINDIADLCGFSDSKYFSRAFKAKKGMSPSEYRTMNNHD